jgi:hypothetical protein
MKRNLNTMSLRALHALLDADTHTVAHVVGNHIARQNGHGSTSIVEHHPERTIPFNDPVETRRGPTWHQREALRKSSKYLGLVSCMNCATRFTENGAPIDGKARVYEDYVTRERWCYVCGTRW